MDFHAVVADLATCDIYIGAPFMDHFEPRLRRSLNTVILYPPEEEPVSLPLRREHRKTATTLCSYSEFLMELEDAESTFFGLISPVEAEPPICCNSIAIMDESSQVRYIINTSNIVPYDDDDTLTSLQ